MVLGFVANLESDAHKKSYAILHRRKMSRHSLQDFDTITIPLNDLSYRNEPNQCIPKSNNHNRRYVAPPRTIQSRLDNLEVCVCWLFFVMVLLITAIGAILGYHVFFQYKRQYLG